MTIKDVLEADGSVDGIEVWIYISSRLQRVYIIGEGSRAPLHASFDRETEAGDIYREGGPDTASRYVIMKRVIQYQHSKFTKKYDGQCVGVLFDQIPKELLDLTVDHMMPMTSRRAGYPDMHRYCFHCGSNLFAWGGIKGEDVDVQREEDEQ